MEIDSKTRNIILHQLEKAEKEHLEIVRFTKEYPGFTLHEGYEVQALLEERRISRGDERTGFKMGLTSHAKMKQMGVEFPIRGILFKSLHRENGSILNLSDFIHPKAEPEIVFFTNKEIKGDVSAEDALNACSHVAAGVEIIDSRYLDFDFKLPDVVADNCSAAAYFVGEKFEIGKFDIGNLGVILEINGKAKTFGSSSAILGHPAQALADLSKMLIQRDRSIPAGSVILAGAATAAVNLEVGDRVSVSIEHLGSIGFEVGKV